MPDMLIRDLPEEVVAALDARAARLGISRSEYVRRRLAQDAAASGAPVSVDDLVRFAKQLGVLPQFPHKKEMTAWAGVAQIKVAGETTSVDFLRFMPGVKSHDVVRFAVERDF